MTNYEMSRLKQTLRLKQKGRREQKGMGRMKNETLLASSNEITRCHPGEQARGMAERASTNVRSDLSGNKEQHYW